jgi:hypothetical protein
MAERDESEAAAVEGRHPVRNLPDTEDGWRCFLVEPTGRKLQKRYGEGYHDWHTVDEMRALDRNATYGYDELPIGAMFYVLDALKPGDDKRALVLVTPGGEFKVDVPTPEGKRWQRSGTPPTITVRPQIKLPGYRGTLAHGILSVDLDGRVY